MNKNQFLMLADFTDRLLGTLGHDKYILYMSPLKKAKELLKELELTDGQKTVSSK